MSSLWSADVQDQRSALVQLDLFDRLAFAFSIGMRHSPKLAAVDGHIVARRRGLLDVKVILSAVFLFLATTETGWASAACTAVNANQWAVNPGAGGANPTYNGDGSVTIPSNGQIYSTQNFSVGDTISWTGGSLSDQYYVSLYDNNYNGGDFYYYPGTSGSFQIPANYTPGTDYITFGYNSSGQVNTVKSPVLPRVPRPHRPLLQISAHPASRPLRRLPRRLR